MMCDTCSFGPWWCYVQTGALLLLVVGVSTCLFAVLYVIVRGVIKGELP